MANNILIVPGQAKIEMHGASASTTNIQVAANGDIQFIGTTDGLLVSISEASDLVNITKALKAQDTIVVGSDYTGTLYGKLNISTAGVGNGLSFYTGAATSKRIWVDSGDDSLNITIGATKDVGFRMAVDGEGYLGGNRILTTADEGTGSGIDADTVDGYHATAYNVFTANAVVTRNASGHIYTNYLNMTADITTSSATHMAIETGSDGSLRWQTPAQFIINHNIWTADNDGTGSGLDADTLDTYEATAFPRKSEDAVISGDWTFNGTTTFVDTTVISTGDNIILLNNDEVGTPTLDSGIEIERGTSANVQWLWDESETYWSPMGGLIGGVADPTADAHVGDRGFNDNRYVQREAQGSDITAAKVFANNVTEYFRSSVGAVDGYIKRLTSDELFVQNATDIVLKSAGDGSIYFRNNANTNIFEIDLSGANTVYVSGNRVLTTADEGTGNGIDADTLDGQEGSYYLPAASYTAADVISKLLTVDGAGSGLDADLFDGISSASFLRSDVADAINSDIALTIGAGEGHIRFYHTSGSNAFAMTPYDGASYQAGSDFSYDADSGYWEFKDRLDIGGALNVTGNVTLTGSLSSPADPTLGNHVGDRDYNDVRYAQLATSNTFVGDLTINGGAAALKLKPSSDDHTYMEFYARTAAATTRSANIGFASTATLNFTIQNEISNGHILLVTTGSGEVKINGSRILTQADEGSGNGIDADTLDSLQSTQFLRSDVNDTINSDVSLTIGAGEGRVRMTHVSAANRFTMIPYDGGTENANAEFGFDADEGYWRFDDRLDVDGILNVGTTAHINDEVQTEKVSIDDTSDNKKFEIVYNAVSASLDFNFVG